LLQSQARRAKFFKAFNATCVGVLATKMAAFPSGKSGRAQARGSELARIDRLEADIARGPPGPDKTIVKRQPGMDHATNGRAMVAQEAE
jgi:hypothetical protein